MPERSLAIPSLEDIRRIFDNDNDSRAGPPPAAPTAADHATPRIADPMENDDD
ncbi:hypothetical protein WCE41_12925 [Luteimonas sp. MJ246]|uniref:hypothetical protein n=1 Tax=Luteimonas sp. MJ174 TaxID=3129237 RepID=UPI0031BB133D